MHVLIISGSYPSDASPAAGSFVREFSLALSRAGCDCTVIAPVSFFSHRRSLLTLPEMTDTTTIENVRVFRPRFLSFSVRDLGVLNTAVLTQAMFNQTVLACLERLESPPDIVYGHFLYQAGRSAVIAARELGKPGIVGVGESSFWTVEPMGFDRARRHFSNATAMLAVSTMIRDELIEKLDILPDKIRVFPNGVDRRLFYPRDRAEMCRKHGIPENTFNISFVGTFDQIKGPARLLEAVRGLRNIGLILVGAGDVQLESEQIAYKGKVPHKIVPELLAASDLFVLPTSEEGSCNAIVEAMACGIPIVTADGRYNDDLVDSTMAIRVDPYNVAEIRCSIIELMENRDRLRALGEGALERSKLFDIDDRARRVKAWFADFRQP